MYQISESNDYETLTYLFFENGLEITPGIHKPDEVIKFWECKDPVSQRLIGGVALEKTKRRIRRCGSRCQY